MDGRKKLLLVAYWYPPRQGIGGRRAAQLRKYLPHYGWDVTVLTARAPGGVAPDSGTVATRYVDVLDAVRRCGGINGTSTHHRLGVALPTATDRNRSLAHRAIALAHQLCTFPDREVGWTPYVVVALRKLLREGRFDAVLTTSPPFTAGVAAVLRDHRTPWIADIRDLWTGTDIIYRDSSIRWLERRLEHWMFRRASAIVGVTNVAAAYLTKQFPAVPVTAIYNAFDPDDWTGIPFERNDRCTLLFAGSMYRMRADPVPFFRAVRRLLDQSALRKDDLFIDFYSDEAATITARAHAEGVSDVVRAYDYVPRETIMRLERRADRLLLLLWGGFGSETVVTGKIFEYLGARRPILAIGGGPSSAVDEVLVPTAAGARCTSAADVESHVMRAVREFKSGQSTVVPAETIAPFDAPHLAEHYAEFLDRVAPAQRSLVR